MPLRMTSRKLATAVGALLFATPVLTSCGFNYATDRVYTPATGVNNRDASVDVLGAVIVSGQQGSGTFIASFANNDNDNPATVSSLEATRKTNTGETPLQVEDFHPIQVPAAGLVNLANEGGVVIKGDFGAGNFVTVKVGFGNGQHVELGVLAVDDCGEFSGLDISQQQSSPSPQHRSPESPNASPKAGAGQSPAASSPSPTAGGTASPTAAGSEAASATPLGTETTGTSSPRQCGATGAPSQE